MQKIKFPKSTSSDFAHTIKTTAAKFSTRYNLLKMAKRELWLKFIFYSLLYISLYIITLRINWSNQLYFLFGYVMFSLTGILLAFNASHDSAHQTFSNKKWVNNIIFRFTFNLQGVNSYLWKKRHIASHHLFPNVDGCDADIDENVFLRLSPSHKARSFHKFQHIYATVLYMMYTLHWIFLKDLGYLTKKRLSNLKNIQHPKVEVFRFFLWKVVYLFFYLVLPIACGWSLKLVLISFFVSHFVISIFFVWTLIISHITIETSFPVQDGDGVLPHDYYAHQLATSMDYRPKNIIMNWVLGGFNAHAAHHLFPKYPHTMNRHMTAIIERNARKHQLQYHCKSFIGALFSHYAYLKKMGNGISINC